MVTTGDTDGELLAARGRDPEAFGAFYRRHVGAILAYVHGRTGRADLAADVCAETFARALERGDDFDPARGPARAWLIVIASSILVDSFRRGQVESRARQRLGMPARELTDADLERIDELVDARRGPGMVPPARSRASRSTARTTPRPPAPTARSSCPWRRAPTDRTCTSPSATATG